MSRWTNVYEVNVELLKVKWRVNCKVRRGRVFLNLDKTTFTNNGNISCCISPWPKSWIVVWTEFNVASGQAPVIVDGIPSVFTHLLITLLQCDSTDRSNMWAVGHFVFWLFFTPDGFKYACFWNNWHYWCQWNICFCHTSSVSTYCHLTC